MAALVRPTTNHSAQRTVAAHGAQNLSWLAVGAAVLVVLLLVGVVSLASTTVQSAALAIVAVAASIGAAWYLNRRRNS